MRILLPVLLVVCVLTPSAAGAQSHNWTARAGHATDIFREDRDAWRTTSASLQRIWKTGAIGIEAGGVDRGAGTEPFAAADIYKRFGRITYANVYAAAAPGAERLAHLNVLAEVYTSPAAPWEVSLGARHQVFSDTQITLGTASVGRYDGPWLTRVRTVVTGKGRLAVSAVASARLFLRAGSGASAQFVEAIAGRGQEAVVEGDTAELRQSWVVAGRLQQPLGATLGLTVGAGYTWDDQLSRFSADAGLSVRF